MGLRAAQIPGTRRQEQFTPREATEDFDLLDERSVKGIQVLFRLVPNAARVYLRRGLEPSRKSYFDFMGLPAELRIKIYRMLVVFPDSVLKSTRYEALSVFYNNNVLEFDSVHSLLKSLKPIDADCDRTRGALPEILLDELYIHPADQVLGDLGLDYWNRVYKLDAAPALNWALDVAKRAAIVHVLGTSALSDWLDEKIDAHSDAEGESQTFGDGYEWKHL
ncbi:hypothetical protein BST61_g5429 [Cercospora zeina]